MLIPRSVSQHRPGVRDDQLSQYDTNDWFSIENESLLLCSLAVISLRIPWDLTFQEYLAAAALNEDAEYLPLLIDNLLNPAWREVVLLYVALANDATAVIIALHEALVQPEGVLLAGYCLAEHVKRVRADVQQLTLTKLKEGFSQADDQTVDHFGKVLVAIGGSDVTAFMRDYLHESQLKKLLAAVRALGRTRAIDPSIESVRDDLVQLVEGPGELEVMVASRESLAQIGDPRFSGKEPRLIRIPQQQTEILWFAHFYGGSEESSQSLE